MAEERGAKGAGTRTLLITRQLAARLAGLAPIRADPQPHVAVRRQEDCRDCEEWSCIYLCPAGVFRLHRTHHYVTVEHELCVECGACYLFCPRDNIAFRWPRPGYGVANRYG